MEARCRQPGGSELSAERLDHRRRAADEHLGDLEVGLLAGQTFPGQEALAVARDEPDAKAAATLVRERVELG